MENFKIKLYSAYQNISQVCLSIQGRYVSSNIAVMLETADRNLIAGANVTLICNRINKRILILK